MYVVAGLLDVLLALADEHDPEPFLADLGTTQADNLRLDSDLDPGIDVYTHFYLPDAGAPVSDVFGLDLGTSPGQTDGRFISHPQGDLRVRSTDELHQILLIAIPPYDRSSVHAFDRTGARLPLEVLDIELPEEYLE